MQLIPQNLLFHEDAGCGAAGVGDRLSPVGKKSLHAVAVGHGPAPPRKHFGDLFQRIGVKDERDSGRLCQGRACQVIEGRAQAAADHDQLRARGGYAEDVDIRLHSIIYKVEEEITAAMIGMLDAIEKETILGKAVVQETFKVSKVGTIAGCRVIDGLIRRQAKARLIRDGVVIWDGDIATEAAPSACPGP